MVLLVDVDVYPLQSQVVSLEKGCFAWVPFGYLVVPLSTAGADNEDEFGLSWACTPFVVDWAAEVGKDVWTSLRALNQAQFQKHGENQMWIDRKQTFDKFSEKVVEALAK